MGVSVAPSRISQSESNVEHSRAEEPPSIVVVGNGPVGFRFLQELVRTSFHNASRITVFGEEPRPAYDRIHLTKFLDDPDPSALEYEPRAWYSMHDIELFTGDPVVAIDREDKIVRSESGRVVAYDQLVLATGSRAFMPPIEGIDEDGVFAYRTIDDLSRIRDYADGCKRAVVLGGGLLGLEAAHALNKLGLNVFVVEMAPALMPRQLDSEGASLLRQLLESPRLRILLQRQTQKIRRIDEGLHVQFTTGESVVADLVVVSAGIRARDEIARECDLPVGPRGGVVVDDRLQTVDPEISAIGECAVHRGTVYGVAAPGFQMAKVLADRLRGMDAAFGGSDEATRLKLVGVDVVFAGDFLDTTRAELLTHKTKTTYTKLIIRRGRLVGMIAVGDVPQVERLREGINQHRRIFQWNRRRFVASGRLWSGGDETDVSNWPLTTVVCHCTGTTRGCLTVARENGACTVAQLAEATGATTVCGSCLLLVQQLADRVEAPVKASRNDHLVLGVSVLAGLLIAVLVFGSPIASPTSVQTELTFWQSMIDSDLCKQVTGYSMLGLTLLSLGLSLRKRTGLLQRIAFAPLRTIHVTLVALALGVLIAHTGFHRGSGLNLTLFTAFLMASVTGSAVGILIGGERRLSLRLRALRRPLTFVHILFLWPLPVLVAFHIVSVYWF